MFSRILFFVFSFSVAYSINAAAAADSSVWEIGEGTKDTLTLVDDQKTVGEEVILLTINKEVKTIKVQDVSIESYGGAYFVADASGNILEDLSIEAVFKSRYEQTLELLKDEKFRAAFTDIPESCEKTANGFLIINDNLQGESYGFCLTPTKAKKPRR